MSTREKRVCSWADTRQKQVREARSRVGLCYYCGAIPIPGSNACGACAEARAEDQARRRQARKEAGTCRACDKPPTPGFKTCEDHRRCAREYAERKRIRRRQRKAGLMVTEPDRRKRPKARQQ